MKKRQLGNSGLRVSALGLGCMGMSWAYGSADKEESLRTIRRALEIGVSFLDTADMYGAGENEKLVGEAIAGRRDQAILATKCGISGWKDGALTVNGRPDYIRRACEASLQRLKTEVIDLYYLHRIDPDVPIEESVGAMKYLVEEGKVRFLGLSEAAPDTVRRAAAVAPISALQSEYSLWTRELEAEMMGLLRELGIGLVPYSPLGRGFLTGQIRSLQDLEEGDFRRTQPRFTEEAFQSNLEVVALVEQLAKEKRVTAAQVALAWVLHQGESVVPIPGTKRVSYLEQNAEAVELELSSAELEGLSEVSSQVIGERYSPALMKAVSL